VTGGGHSTPEIRIVGRRTRLRRLPAAIISPEKSVRAALSKLIESGVTGGGHSTPEIRIVGRRTSSGDYRRR
jgi:hypothetical protein